jgi:hypothetical protein
MGLVGIQAAIGQFFVQKILRQNPGHDGLANAAFFTADKMNYAHKLSPVVDVVDMTTQFFAPSKHGTWRDCGDWG